MGAVRGIGLRLARAAGLPICVLAALLVFGAGSAMAVKVHPFISQFPVSGSKPSPEGIAVNEITHRIYLVTSLEHKILQLTENGTPYAPQPVISWEGNEPNDVAVDNSSSTFNGYLYVSGVLAGFVQQYSPAGTATGVQIKASSIPPNGTSQSGGLADVVNTGDFAPKGVAVGPSGSLFVSDNAAKAVDEFSPSGTFIAQYGVGLKAESLIAVGHLGEIYLGSGSGLIELDSSGACINSCTPITSKTVRGIAADSAGNLLASIGTGLGSGGLGSKLLYEFDSSGSQVSASGTEFNTAAGIALDQSLGKIYVVDDESISTQSEPPNVKVFGPLITLPDATTESVTAVTGSSAEAHGVVNADGGPAAGCKFEYTDELSFKSEGFQSAAQADCVPGGPFTGEGNSSVHAALTGLNAGTRYHYRLVATNSNGPNRGQDVPFETLGPSIQAQVFSQITEVGATLEATINPRGEATRYHFEYVDQAGFDASEWAGATEVPLGGAEIPAGSSGVGVSVAIAGLIPGTGYHFRVVATNPKGEATGPDSAFVTFAPASPALPDARAYEQASPIDKNGTNVGGTTDTVQAARGGNGITFYSNAGLPGGEGAQNFPLFLATRGGSPSAWTTQGLLPPASTGPRGFLTGWSEDLAWSFSANFFPGSSGTLYAKQSSSHELTQIAAGLGGTGASGQPVPAYAGTSADDSIVVFEDIAALAAGAKSGKRNVYAWDRSSGAIRLASVFNNGVAPTQGAYAGPYDWFSTFGPGASGNYYTQFGKVISDDGTHIFFTAANSNQIYVRINPLQPQSAVNGQGECLEPAAACTVQVSKSQAAVPDPLGEMPAILDQATPDGRFVLFMSPGKLTDDATTGPTDEGRDLYRFDVETGGLIDLTPDPSATNGAAVQGVVGISDDGSYVYFVANGNLASGGSAGTCTPEKGNCSLYVWHAGTTKFIAPMNAGPAPNSAVESDLANWLPGPGLLARRFGRTSRVTADGKVLVFRSRLRLTAYDNDGEREIYRYDAAGGEILNCISCNPTNLPPAGSAGLQSIPEPFVGSKTQASFLTRNLSASGDRIFFDTPDQLVVTDVNGVNDVYEWEAKGTGSCQTEAVAGGCLFLISTGTSPEPSYFGDASPSGNDIFFFTEQALVMQDRDPLQDVYDARVGGGIPAQNTSEPPLCSGESCLGTGTSGPVTSPPASVAANGSGNVKPLKCKKGEKKVKRNGKTVCVKKHLHHKKKSSRRGASQAGGRAK